MLLVCLLFELRSSRSSSRSLPMNRQASVSVCVYQEEGESRARQYVLTMTDKTGETRDTIRQDLLPGFWFGFWFGLVWFACWCWCSSVMGANLPAAQTNWTSALLGGQKEKTTKQRRHCNWASVPCWAMHLLKIKLFQWRHTKTTVNRVRHFSAVCSSAQNQLKNVAVFLPLPFQQNNSFE